MFRRMVLWMFGLLLPILVVQAPVARATDPSALAPNPGWVAPPEMPAPARHAVPPDGVYLVLRASESADSLEPLAEGEHLAVYTRAFAAGPDQGPPEYMVIYTRPEVHLDLAEKPKMGRGPDGKLNLQFRLQPLAAAELEALTRDHQGARAAVFIGGQVVTVHKIRSVISGGALQISCCDPRACGYLQEKLKKNVPGAR
jgi:hypothetical protein